MHIVSRRPWSRIPRRFQTTKEKIHSILLFVGSAWILLYVWGMWLYTYLVTYNPIPTNAVAILLDTSISMSANDVIPNRYRHAISIATWLMHNYPAAYITIPFGWIPTVRTPWSEDSNGIETVMSQYNLWSYHVNQAYMWSAPGNAIWLARDYLKKYPWSKKTIVILWDGNTNTWYSIDAFLPYLVQDKIELLICAMWDTENVLWRNYADSDIVNAIDLDRMTYITQQTNGKRWICNNTEEAVERLMLKIREWTTLNTTLHLWDNIRTMRQNPVLHWITIGLVLYILITTTRGFIRYIFYTEW